MSGWTLPACGHLECADHPETCPDIQPVVGWYVEVVREEPFENILIGPFDTEAAATVHVDSADVDDWCYGEAKAKGYIVEDVLVVENPTLIPSYGVNAPVTES